MAPHEYGCVYVDISANSPHMFMCLACRPPSITTSRASNVISNTFRLDELWVFLMKSFGAIQDTIQTFYDITHREVETLELKTSAKDREMELMEDNHRQEN